MKGTFAYSLDRENFTGIYNTRSEAVAAGFARAARISTPINEIYVGQRVTGDAQANLHVWAVIKAMRDRARAAYGEDARDYLAQVTAAQAEDLDRALEAVITRWLQNYKLGPSFFRIEAVSEHPVPTVHQVHSRDDDEVYDLGESVSP